MGPSGCGTTTWRRIRHTCERAKEIQHAWAAFTEAKVITRQVSERAQVAGKDTNQVMIEAMAGLGPVRITTALLHRSFSRCCGLWDSYCDVSWYVSCGCIYVPSLEISQFIGLAIMMGTVWLRLHTSQEYIQPFVNAIVSPTIIIANKHQLTRHSSLADPLCPLWQ